MPVFKSTYNILKKQDEDEVYNPNWMDSDTLVLPPKKDWDYSRELIIEDIDIWEVLYEASGGIGVYASWSPYAEFYMVTTGIDYRNQARFINGFPYWDRTIETYYGSTAQKQVYQRCKQLNIQLPLFQNWIEDDTTVQLQQDKKIIII